MTDWLEERLKTLDSAEGPAPKVPEQGASPASADWLEKRLVELGQPAASYGPGLAPETRRSGQFWAGQAAKGVENLAGLPGDLQQMTGLGPIPLPGGQLIMPTSAQLTQKREAMGLPSVPASGPLETFGGAALRALPMAGLDLATGGSLTPALGANIGGALAGQAAENYTGSPAIGAGAGVTAGLLGSIGQSLSGRAAVRKAVSDAQQALEESGQVLKAGKALAKGKISEAKDAAELQQQQLLTQAGLQGDSIDRLASQMIQGVGAKLHPTIATEQAAGEAAQTQARNWLTKDMPQQQDQLFQKLISDPRLPLADMEPAPLRAYSAMLGKIQDDGKLGTLVADLKPRLPAQLQAKLEALTPDAANIGAKPASVKTSPIVDSSGQPIQTVVPGSPGVPISIGDVKILKTALGDAMANPKVLADLGQQNLKAMYAALSADQRAAFEKFGMGQDFDAYNKASERLYDLASGPVAKIVGSPKASLTNDPGAGKVPGILLKPGQVDATDLQALRSEPGLSPIVDQISAPFVKKTLASNPEEWHRLSPEVKNTILPDKDQQTVLDFAAHSKGAIKEMAQNAAEAAKAQAKSQVKGVKQSQSALVEQLQAQQMAALETKKQASDAALARLGPFHTVSPEEKAIALMVAGGNVAAGSPGGALVGLIPYLGQIKRELQIAPELARTPLFSGLAAAQGQNR